MSEISFFLVIMSKNGCAADLLAIVAPHRINIDRMMHPTIMARIHPLDSENSPLFEDMLVSIGRDVNNSSVVE